eukprot:gene22307-39589_t
MYHNSDCNIHYDTRKPADACQFPTGSTDTGKPEAANAGACPFPTGSTDTGKPEAANAGA